MSKQIKLPYDVKQECLWIVRGYRRRVNAYKAARREIMEGTPCRYRTIKDQKTGKYIRAYPPMSGGASRSAEEKALQLEALEDWPETKRMRAVEWARDRVGLDIVNPESRMRLADALVTNCESGRKHPFEVLYTTEFSRRDFYRRKDAFLADVAKYLNLI